MFYEAQILCQHGQLGKVWIAAHWDKKLSKTTLSQVSSSNIVKDAGTWIWRDSPVFLRAVVFCVSCGRQYAAESMALTLVYCILEVILSHEGAFSLRLRGHLLFGLCRIYYKKVDFLYSDCTKVLVKIKNVRLTIILSPFLAPNRDVRE